MASWDDLVLAGQPRLINYYFETTAGADWKFVVGPFGPRDGEPVDLSGATFECKVTTDGGSDVVVTWTVTGDDEGYLTGTVDDADADVEPGQRFWYCVGTLSGAKVSFWGAGTSSPFLIHEGV